MGMGLTVWKMSSKSQNAIAKPFKSYYFTVQQIFIRIKLQPNSQLKFRAKNLWAIMSTDKNRCCVK